MRKIIFLSIIVFFSVLGRAQDITSVFLSVPDKIVFGLDAEDKDRLVANPGDTAKVSVSTSLYKEIERISMSDDYITLRTSPIGTLQIKLLPLVNNSIIICVVNTVCGKACDSNVRFFTTEWVQLENSGLFPEVRKDWFMKSEADRSSEEFKNSYAALDMTPVRIDLSGNDFTLTAHYDIQNYLSQDDYKRIEPYLTKEPRIFVWDKTSFK